MATAKKSTAKKQLPDDNQIIAWYMEDVLGNEGHALNVYSFCKQHDLEEAIFYSFFGSIDAIRQEIWVKFFENAVVAIEKEPGYSAYSDKNKLLTLYFTLFEILTLNRSYVLFALQEQNEGMRSLMQLKQFRNRFKDFIVHIIKGTDNEMVAKVKKVTSPAFSEGAWIQFLLILRFWMKDNSRGFEKTDIIIEKSVNTVVDLLDTKPLENLIDLGKFLWKERKSSL
ncbi:MAG: heat-shock protein [Flavobacterium sp. BFFFF1]|uniref:TetR family transcriptional regulator C-terminal domain-containing protein n=1 Tax=Flavobacterium sp. BFFFF1 TaxID=2015557 RepID=UPI000BD0A583|nr:TetR family transcriptional regulator C-terminal domain-containing protein [Flavobacterium sp. BFFFF1]OYU80611.1 MAG: heat-shock protein [Flavobacterium sp. BFFFF1]